MNWYLNINQKALVELNSGLSKPLDLKDAVILEWMLKFHAEPKSQKKVIDDKLFFWASYQLILDENPLLQISNKQVVSRRLLGMVKVGLLEFYIDSVDNSKTFFSITQTCFNLLKRGGLTQKSLGVDSKVIGGLTQKLNNKYINNKYIISVIEKLKNNKELLQLAAMQNYQSLEKIECKIEVFANHSFSVDGEVMDKDLFRHFGNWIRKQDFSKEVSAESVEWFIKMFNKVSRGKFVATKKVKELFSIQLANGFTGDQMKIGIKNMYSSDDRNVYHKSKGYQFATPVHFLKDDNVNRYLNQRF
tara:strand:+ start:9480 stop:10388 length:909 start_codon:yes stop_codon:yes gene_type:complete